MASSPLCWFNRHDPNLDLVRQRFDGFVGHCRHCDAPVRRVSRTVWIKRETQTALI